MTTTPLPTPDLSAIPRATLEFLAERLLLDLARQHGGGLREVCVAYGIPVVTR